MSHSIAREKISRGTTWRPPALGSAVRGLLARYGAWVRRLDDAERPAELDPRLAGDIGAAPGCERCPESFAVDPRPLWGIGLTLQPTEVSGRRASE